MAEREWRGHWWVRDAPEDRAPGRLIVDESGHCRLELVGGLDLGEDPQDEAHGVTVLGVANGQDVTLLQCSTQRRDGFGRRPHRFHDIRVQNALVGAHVAPGEAAFTSATVNIENLSSWFGSGDYTERGDDDEGAESATSRRPPRRTCEVDGWEYTVAHTVQPFHVRKEHGGVRLESETTAYLLITPPRPVAVEEFYAPVLEMMDLLTLASGEPSGQISLLLVHKEPMVQSERDGARYTVDRRVECFGPRIHEAVDDAPSPLPHRWRFTCADRSFEEILPAWLALRRRAPLACNVLFGLQYTAPRFGEVRTQLVAVAAETLHASLFASETELPPAEFDALRERVLASLTSPTERNWVLSRLRNQPSFRARMTALARRPDVSAVRELIPDIDAWARQLRNVRNDLAHTGNAQQTDQLFPLERATLSLLHLVLMAELGLPATVQERAARGPLTVGILW